MTNFTMLCHNRPRLTRQALESLARSLSSPEEMSVTLLHDGNDDELLSVIYRCSSLFKHATLISTTDQLGTGGLRNMVIESSERTFTRRKYLYLSDNDVFFHPRWHETLVSAYEAARPHGYRVLGAYNHPFHHPVSVSHLWGGWCVKEVQALALQSMLMRWEVFDKYGPFADTTPGKVCDGEDVAFSHAIQADGFKVGVISPAMIVNCGVTNSFGQPIPGADLVRREAPQGVLIE